MQWLNTAQVFLYKGGVAVISESGTNEQATVPEQ